ncbi:MAG: flagellar biosynthetic protein FliP, partial [Gemmobacter sp.]
MAAARILPVLIAVLFLGALPAAAQEITLTIGDGGSFSARAVQLLVLVTLLSLVPGLAVMVTCFPFIVTVLSILRQALGLQSAPPNMMIVSLALFLTWFVMDPVLTEAWAAGLGPLSAGELALEPALVEPRQHIRDIGAV